MIHYNPRGAILEAWNDLENSLDKALAAIGASKIGRGSRLFTALVKANMLNDRQVMSLRTLRDLRDQTASNPDFRPTSESAEVYVKIAKAFRDALDQDTQAIPKN